MVGSGEEEVVVVVIGSQVEEVVVVLLTEEMIDFRVAPAVEEGAAAATDGEDS